VRIPQLMAIVAVVANAAACPGFEVPSKQDQDQKQKDQKQKDQNTLGPGPRHPQGEACRERPLRKLTVQEAVNPNVIRITTETGSGTGFRLASPKGEILIVTDAGVVGDDEKISAVLATSSGDSIEVGLEVGKDDPQHRLAILRAPSTPGVPRGLYVNPAGVRMNQNVVAVGYPAVAGPTATLSFESGKVVALNREVDGRSYLQTDNPGTDGGPIVDACGAVVGVVVALHGDAGRIHLIVPGEHVLALHDRYAAPPESPSTRIRTRTAMLEQSLRLQKGDDAAEVFSRQFLRENVWSDFLEVLRQAKAQEERYAAEMRKAGMVYADEPFEKRAQFLSGLLTRAQHAAWYVGEAMAHDGMKKYEALYRYFARSALLPNLFGALTGLQVVDVIKESEASAVARVQVVSGRVTKVYDFQWKLESGDWHIAKLTCLSGCRR
jgi:hypothetical protein